MKTKTVSGTKVEIIGICYSNGIPTNQVFVKVDSRNSTTMASTLDLIKPEGNLAPEFEGLNFYDAANALSLTTSSVPAEE